MATAIIISFYMILTLGMAMNPMNELKYGFGIDFMGEIRYLWDNLFLITVWLL